MRIVATHMDALSRCLIGSSEKHASAMGAAIAKATKSPNVAAFKPSATATSSRRTRGIPAPGTNFAGMGAHTRPNPAPKTGDSHLPGMSLTAQANTMSAAPQASPAPLSTTMGSTR